MICPRCKLPPLPGVWRLFPKHGAIYCQNPNPRIPGLCLANLVDLRLMEAPPKVKQARKKKNTGKPLENALKAGCKVYAAQNRAFVEKVPTLWTRRSADNFGRMKTKRGDFHGALANGGKTVDFEAKSTTGDRWPASMLTEGQREVLGRCHRIGGLAGVVVRVRARAEGEPSVGEPIEWWVPWARVPSRGSMTIAELDEAGVRLRRKATALLWLDAAEEAEKRRAA